jgi:hypothetical protein
MPEQIAYNTAALSTGTSARLACSTVLQDTGGSLAHDTTFNNLAGTHDAPSDAHADIHNDNTCTLRKSDGH